jgi:DNA-binding CsgD family transcriptional regulator
VFQPVGGVDILASPTEPHLPAGRSAPAGTLIGSLEATALCAEVARNPLAPARVLVVGTGGTGKTTVLDALARLWSAAGVSVLREPGRRPRPADGEYALLVDDARAVPDEGLEFLAATANSETARLVVAARPGPTRPALDALAAALGRVRPPIVLGRLDPTQTRARVEALCPRGATAALAEWIHQQAGGNPRLVSLLATALRDAALIPDRPAADWVPTRVPTSVLEQIRLEVDLLGVDSAALLHALAIGTDPDAGLLDQVLGIGPERIERAAQDATSSGLLIEAGTVLPIVRVAVRVLTPPMRLQALRSRLATLVLARGGSMLPYARELAGVGATGPEVAAVLVAGAGEAVDPRIIASLLAEAVRAGAPVESVAGRMARATALTGDLDYALRLADRAVGDPAAPDRDIAITVAAAVLAGRGMLARSAALYRWFAGQQTATLAPAAGTEVNRGVAGQHPATLPPAAVPALLGTGDLAGAVAAVAAGAHTLPTLGEGVEALLAEGLLETVTGTPSAALSKLARAAALLEPGATRALLSDSPAALAAVVALNCGEFGVAESVLARAVGIGLGGEFARSRHQVLQAWIAMQRGDLERARALLACPGPGGGALEPREELIAAAIEVGIARREGNLAALSTAWARARQAVVRHPVDLFTLHALGELSVAAERLKEAGWVAPHLAEAWALLDRLGEPPLWAAPMHWYAVQAAGLAERPDAAAAHVAALEAATAYPPAQVLAEAARCWMRVLAGQIDAAEVAEAARRLHAIGHAWDASRLAGQAAVRAADRAVMTGLLSCARSLRPDVTNPEPRPLEPLSNGPVEPSPRPAPPVSRAGEVALSDREREVAALLVDGLTYKEIGARLFISAKTVEHHIARIRHRCGATSRADLFSRLRSTLEAAE